MGEEPLSEGMVEVVAQRFKALGEPARLRILDALRGGALTVSEIMTATFLQQANVSGHLRVLHGLGFVERRKEKLNVYYSLQSEDVFRLCDIMCARVEAEVRRSARTIGVRRLT